MDPAQGLQSYLYQLVARGLPTGYLPPDMNLLQAVIHWRTTEDPAQRKTYRQISNELSAHGTPVSNEGVRRWFLAACPEGEVADEEAQAA